MSETVHYSGILTEIIPQEGKSLHDVARKILGPSYEEEINKDFDGAALECLQDNCCSEYTVVAGKLYKITEKKDSSYSDIFNASRNPDGTINFEVKYYNGGCGFDEAIEIALKKI